MKKQVFNPYMPSWEFVPDGEPHVFDGRVWVYGSHDLFGGDVFCIQDYTAWSAPVNDLTDWRCEGVIYRKTDDPKNRDGLMNLFAPDVTRGPDGKYYLYYVLDGLGIVSVAVSPSPAGPFAFWGYVRDESGVLLGERPGDEPQFDPGVLTEGKNTFLYTGFSHPSDTSRHGAMATVLKEDMLTIAEEPRFIVPGGAYAAGTSFESHPFFEASSIRRHGKDYVFVYSSAAMHELCYALSRRPTEGFTYGGVIVSNCDIGISSYKDADAPIAAGGNNHGGLTEINGQWYIFYHRHTNGTWYCRQGCAEKVFWDESGHLEQAEITSCGLNAGPLEGEGEYPADIACHLYVPSQPVYAGTPGLPRITRDSRDGEKGTCHIADIRDGTVIGFKSFDFRGVTAVEIVTRGYGHGRYQIMTDPHGEVLGEIEMDSSNVWTCRRGTARIPDGVHPLFLRFVGRVSGSQGAGGSLKAIRLIRGDGR